MDLRRLRCALKKKLGTKESWESKMKLRHQHEKEKIELQMTPMIDIVFQLLIFFIMTFKIVSLEGDFNIRMPASAPSDGAPDEDQLPPMKLRMQAGADGALATMQLNNQAFDGFKQLHQYIFELVGDDAGPGGAMEGAEVELDCDYQLRYEHVIEAITAVSGYRTEDDQIVKLIERIKFAPPKKPAE